MDSISLKYTDTTDKANGIAGMAITLIACQGEHLLAEIRFDEPDGHNMHMAHDFGLPGNPRMSAKSLWSQSVKDLRAMASMVLGNIECRKAITAGFEPGFNAERIVRDLVRSEGQKMCSLDKDEADTLFDSCQHYVRRLFAHPDLLDVARRFSAHISDRRILTKNETVEFLAALGLR